MRIVLWVLAAGTALVMFGVLAIAPVGVTMLLGSGGGSPGCPPAAGGAQGNSPPGGAGCSAVSQPVSLAGGALAPASAAAVIVQRASSQMGLPYVWGGNGPQAGHRGFDCSGLMVYAFEGAGIQLPRTTKTMWAKFAPTHPPITDRGQVRAGDLLFFSTPSEGIHHVGLALDGLRMLHAPRRGTRVSVVANVWGTYLDRQFIGAIRLVADPATAPSPSPAGGQPNGAQPPPAPSPLFPHLDPLQPDPPQLGPPRRAPLGVAATPYTLEQL